MLDKKPKQPWDRKPNESRQNYAAFCAYRDLGPSRSIDAAFAALNPTVKRKGRPAEYFVWSSKFEWVKRAEAFDAYAEEVQRKAFEARLKKLAHDQADFAVEEFRRLVDRVRKADRILDKADALPVTDIEREEIDEKGRRKRTRIRGADMAKYAVLMKAIADSARRAILGPREGDSEDPAQGVPEFIVSGPEDDRKAA